MNQREAFEKKLKDGGLNAASRLVFLSAFDEGWKAAQATKPVMSENEAVKVMIKHMGAEWLSDRTGWLIPAVEAYRALLAAGALK